ncbi:MAG TPA: ATP-binding protein [Candidatus Kapabacteria bacterium]|nr:ATP-binding protein [Candidatus Kapabacteria bacterium]
MNSILIIEDEPKVARFIIAQRNMDHIFDRFWRADRSCTRTQGGSGLGLAIAKQYADRLGILLDCTSILDNGTLMKCTFPVSG